MIHFCTCSGGSASNFGQTRKQEVKPSCKNCGGEQSVDGRVAASGSMLSTGELEISRVIDPDLNWKTVSKSNRRGARRVRSSFAIDQKKRPASDVSLKMTEDLTDRDLRRAEDIRVSESEEVGVTVLGRHFSDTIEIVPLKKRKFVLAHSASPPPQIRSRSKDFDHLQKVKSDLYLKESTASVNAERQFNAIDCSVTSEFCHDDADAIGGRTNKLEEINGNLEDNVDFSGISILAAAACSSIIGASTSGSAGNAESAADESHQEHPLNKTEIEDHKTDVNICVEVPFCTERVTGKEQKDLVIESNNGKSGKKMSGNKSSENSVDLQENATLRRVESTSRDDRSHWDLNVVMESWENPCGDISLQDQPTICEDEMHEGKLGKSESSEMQPVLGDTDHAVVSTDQQMVGVVGLTDGGHDSCGSLNSKMQKEPEYTSGGSVSSVPPNEDGTTYISVVSMHHTVEQEFQLDSCRVDDKFISLKVELPSCNNNSLDNFSDEGAETKSLHDKSEMGVKVEDSASAPVDCVPLHIQESILSGVEVVAPSIVDFAPECEGDSTLAGDSTVIGAKDVQCVDHGKVEKNEILLSFQVANKDKFINHPTVVSPHHPEADPFTGTVVSEDRDMESLDDNASQPGDKFMAKAETRIPNCLRSLQAENQQAFHGTNLDKESFQLDNSLTASWSVEQTSGLFFDGDISKNNTSNDGIPCQAIKSEPLQDASGKDLTQSERMDELPYHFDKPVKESPACQDLFTGGACIGADDAGMKVQDGKLSAVSGGKLDSIEIDVPKCIDSKDTMHILPSETGKMLDTISVMGQLSPTKCNAINHVSSYDRIAVEHSTDGDYDSDVSQNDLDYSGPVEKISECQVDDDYQYEDGEFRESGLHNWGHDACEEGEAEHVDYGSDSRDVDVFETTDADYVASALQVESVECRKEASTNEHACQEGDPIRQENEKATDPQPFLHDSLNTDVSEIRSVINRGMKVVQNVSREDFGRKDGRMKHEMNVNEMPGYCADDGKAMENDDFAAKVDGDRESRKSTGWDQLPEIGKSSGEAVAIGDGNSSRNSTCDRLDSSDAGKSLIRLAGSTSARELSSCIEGPRSSDMSYRKDKVYVQRSRSNDLDDSNTRGERDNGPGKSFGRVGSPVHLRHRSRGDHWLDSPGGQWRPNRHRSPVYFGQGEFGPPGSNNAAVAAAAKVERSGFFVASDGTIVKAGVARLSGRVGRRSANVSSQSGSRPMVGRGSPIDREGALRFGMRLGRGAGREMSPDRNINIGMGRSERYGPRVVGARSRERFNGSMPDDSIDSMQHPLSRRERSFSPIPRRALHLPQPRARSRSRSRTRSPHVWTSPKGRSSGGIVGGPGLRRYSRSPPGFRSNPRMERLRSPHRRPGFTEMVDFIPSSRRQGSSPRSARWIDDRKDAPDYFREHEYQQSSVSERSPPGRVFTRRQKIDLMDSPERLKPDEYYKPMNSSRFPEFVGVGRGRRHDGSDDDRNKHGQRYGMVHSLRHYDADGEVKRFHYEAESGFRGYSSRPKNAMEFHGGGSPRDYERGINSRLGDGTSRRVREEKGHSRYGREGKQGGGYKTFGMRECDEDVAPRRRRPS